MGRVIAPNYFKEARISGMEASIAGLA